MDILAEYKISDLKILPSVFGKSKLERPDNPEISIHNNQDDYFLKICQKIKNKNDLDVPVLVFFRNESTLNNFYNCQQFKLYKSRAKIINEKSEDVDILIKESTDRGAITLLTRTFGRGCDFSVDDSKIDNAGGLMVIQAFYSEDQSE